jgi:hypothetical protein
MENLPFALDFQDINKPAIFLRFCVFASLRLCGKNFPRPDAAAPQAD